MTDTLRVSGHEYQMSSVAQGVVQGLLFLGIAVAFGARVDKSSG